MRLLVIFLLAINVFFFLWAITLGDNHYQTPPMVDPEIPAIIIPPQSPGSAISRKQTLSKCFTVGPFSSEKTARIIAQKINEQGLATAIKKQKTRQTLDYLVYLNTFPSKSAAEKVLNDVQKNKITNAKIIEAGPYKNAITLGTFNDLDKARRHAEYIRFLGYDALYTAQKKQKEIIWLDYDEPVRRHTPVLSWIKEIDPNTTIQKIEKPCEY